VTHELADAKLALGRGLARQGMTSATL
jgi:hypothetical protein